ncbi:inositol phospholipid synthesis and fat-storage-inducing TM-domain-containing protein [Aspergillus unguis]
MPPSTTSPPPTRFTPPSIALAIYPATLLLGSLFSVLSPTARQPPPDPVSAESGSPAAPINYFARKDNIFNVFFVKIGWLWFTLAFALIILAYPFSSNRGTKQAQAGARYALATVVWYLTTQWFFGPPIIDRSFVFTGGKCESVLSDLNQAQSEKGVVGAGVDEGFRVHLTAAACKAAGGAWRGGHDVSGHVFMLVLLTAVLGFEAVGLWSQSGGDDGEEKAEPETQSAGRTWTLRFVGGIVGLGWWMLLMTAIWFHTWLEKANGLLISLAAVYTIYILPRRVIPWRNIVGIPGV